MDKQDELERVIEKARDDWHNDLDPVVSLNVAIAAAVRSFMGSHKVVERVARAIDPEIWSDDLPIPTRDAVNSFHVRRQRSSEIARAALSALIGEDIGGGRGS